MSNVAFVLHMYTRAPIASQFSQFLLHKEPRKFSLSTNNFEYDYEHNMKDLQYTLELVIYLKNVVREETRLIILITKQIQILAGDLHLINSCKWV